MAQQYSLNHILKLLDLTKDTDPDLRFMALNDLDKIICEAPQLFPNYNRTTLVYCNILVKSLDDENSEVQNQAVKCFILLTPLLKVDDVLVFIDQLMSSKAENTSLIVSSVYTTAIKSILGNLKINSKDEGEKLTGHLLARLLDYGFLVSKIDIIEILNETIKSLGLYFHTEQITKVYELLVKVVFRAENTISKASLIGISAIANLVDDRGMSSMLTLINSEFESSISTDKASTDEFYKNHSLRLSIFTVLCKIGSSVVNVILPTILLTITDYLSKDSANPDDNEDFDHRFKNDQIKDDALLCLEAVVQNVPYEIVSPYLTTILGQLNQLLKYDPFHSDSSLSDEEDDSPDDADFDFSDNEDFDFEPEDEEENDYDLSWSLRKNSLKIIGKVSDNYPITLKKIYSFNLFQTLSDRVSDSSINASNEIISTLTKLITNTSKNGDYYTISFYDLISNNIRKRRSEQFEADVMMSDEEPNPIDPYESLSQSSELICEKVLTELLTEKNLPRFSSIFSLISQLTIVLQGLPGNYLYRIVEKLNDMNLKSSIDLLQFYCSLLTSDDLTKFGDQIGPIVASFISALQETNNYELSLEGLNSSEDFFNSIQTDQQQLLLDHDQILSLVQLLSSKASSKSYSNEVKQKCLHSIGILIKNYTLFSEQELSSLLEIYSESLDYESLVEVSISELTTIIETVSGKLRPNALDTILSKFINIFNLRSFELKTASLEFLLALSRSSASLSDPLIEKIVKTMLEFVKQSSLQGKQFSDCLSVIGNFTMKTGFKIIETEDFLKIISLSLPIVTSLDQESVLNFVEVATLNVKEQNLFNITLDKFESVKSKEFQSLLPGILASIAVSLKLENEIKISESFVLEHIDDSTSEKLDFHVTFLGFVGRKISLPGGIEPFISILSRNHDPHVKSCALTAIGNIASSDISKYLPIILKNLSSMESLTLSLKKILDLKTTSAGLSSITPLTPGITSEDYSRIWALLLEIAERKTDLKLNHLELNLISECLSCIAVLELSRFDTLIESIDSTASLSVKYTIVSTIKFFINYTNVLSQESGFDKNLTKLLEKSSLLIFNDNLQLKQTSAQALITSLHNKPTIALPILIQLLSTIMEKELTIRKEYIETIQIGPFKHKIDNALDLRKSIYEMIYTLMTIIENNQSNFKKNSLQRNLNYFDILKICIEKGLKDDNDVIQLSSLIITKVINLKPDLLFSDAELLTFFKERCLKIINKKMKETDTKQVLEKQKESVKSIKSLITNIDKVFHKTEIQDEKYEEWRKFAFVNGNT